MKINKNPIWLIFTLTITVIMFTLIGFSNENFNIFIISWFTLYILYFIIFEISKFEKFIQKNITYIIIILIGLLLGFQEKLGINNKDVLIMIGSAFAFWYGYKKYERDKEIEILDKYSKKYDFIKNNFKEGNAENDLNIYINKLFKLIQEEHYLYSKGYISQSLWFLWCKYIKINIDKILLNSIDQVSYILQPYTKIKHSHKNKEFLDFININLHEIYVDNMNLLKYIIEKDDNINKIYLNDIPSIHAKITQNIKLLSIPYKLRHLNNLNTEQLKTIYNRRILQSELILIILN